MDKKIVVNGNEYILIENYRDAFELEEFLNKCTDYFVDYDYIVGDKVKYNNYIYECIIEHHSDLVDFDNDKDNWIIELDKYYNVTSTAVS